MAAPRCCLRRLRWARQLFLTWSSGDSQSLELRLGGYHAYGTRVANRRSMAVARKLDAIKAFATLEGSALEALAPHVRNGLAQAIRERAAKETTHG